MATQKKVILLTDDMQMRIREMQKKFGMLSAAEVIRASISFMYEKRIDNYVSGLKKTASRITKTPEEKAQEDIDRAKGREQLKDDALRGLCAQLGGEIDEHNRCVYKQYEISPRGHVDVSTLNPLYTDITEWDLKDQYRGKDGQPCDKKLVDEAGKLKGYK